jgi:hypothetical protein
MGSAAAARREVAIPTLYRTATLLPATLAADGNAIDVVWTTGAAVKRQGFWDDEPWLEELSLAEGACDLSRLNDGAAVLDSHKSYMGVRAILGAVEPGSARIEAGRGVATLRFSTRAEVADLIGDIRTGIIRNLSCGYQIDELNEVQARDRKAGKLAHYRADHWTPFEVSFVAVGADAGAQTREDRPTPHRCFLTRRLTMPDDDVTTQLALPQTREVERPQPPDAPDEPTPDEPTPDDKESAARGVLAAERKRVQEIRDSVRAGGLDETFADEFIAKGTAIGEVARAVLAERARTQAPPSRTVVEVRADGLSRMREGITYALMRRIAPMRTDEALAKLPEQRRAEITEAAADWQGRTLMEIGRACLEARGVKLRGVGRMELAAYALNLSAPSTMLRDGPHGYLATSDFPSLLAQIGRVQLTAGYTAAPRTFTGWCRQGTLPDFRITTKVSLGMGPKFLKVPEHGEYARGMLGTQAATAQLGKYGRILAFTREAMVNDDVGLFNRIPQLFGNSAAMMEGDVVYGILMANPPMPDGNALFSAPHGNLMIADTINVKSVGTARAAMMNQKSPDGQFLSINPRFMIVGPQQEVSALQFLAPITIVGAIGNLVPEVYRAMQLVVDPRITDISWYLAASPDQIDTIEYDYLEGAAGGGPTLETREGWDIDGQEYKAREEFTATAIDYRGLVKNPGVLPTILEANAAGAPAPEHDPQHDPHARAHR